MRIFEYAFKGKIHPERVKFSAPSFSFGLQHENILLDGQGEISIEESIINIRFYSPTNHCDSETCNLETLKNFIEDVARCLVDTYCYVNSYAYDVEISSVHSTDLALDYIFGVKGEWDIEKDHEIANIEFDMIMALYAKPESQFIKDVLADFRRAIKYPSMTASFCFRAIETIRRNKFEDESIVENDKRRKNGWTALRNKFHLVHRKLSYLKFCILR